MAEDRRELHRVFKMVDRPCRAGDLAALRAALGDPLDFPNALQPEALGCGDFPLEYAIYWSPLAFVRELLDAGADPKYHDRGGFPSLIAALSTERPDRNGILVLLLERGADLAQRGLNGWTPLHYAVARRDLDALRILLAHGADPSLRTDVDDYATPLEDAEAAGFQAAVDLLNAAAARGPGERR